MPLTCNFTKKKALESNTYSLVMSNPNQLLYFISQAYRQVQLSVDTGTQPFPYSEFSRQVTGLLAASGNEAYTRKLTVELVEEAAQYKETTDYVRQELAFETKACTLGDWVMALERDEAAHADSNLQARRLKRHTNNADQFAAELA